MMPEIVPEPEPPKIKVPLSPILTPLATTKSCELLFVQAESTLSDKTTVPNEEANVVVPLIVLLIVTPPAPEIVKAGVEMPPSVTVPSSKVIVLAVIDPDTLTV